MERMMFMLIRKAISEDMDEILRVYAAARRYMAENGNPTQWGSTNPPRETLEADIVKGDLYVGVDVDGRVTMAFALIFGDDPTYEVIEGKWLNDKPYATIHRIGSDGRVHGAFAACVEYAAARCKNLRVDTHRDNATMQHLITKHGFSYCGIIYIADGTPRLAYQRNN